MAPWCGSIVAKGLSLSLFEHRRTEPPALCEAASCLLLPLPSLVLLSGDPASFGAALAAGRGGGASASASERASGALEMQKYAKMSSCLEVASALPPARVFQRVFAYY